MTVAGGQSLAYDARGRRALEEVGQPHEVRLFALAAKQDSDVRLPGPWSGSWGRSIASVPFRVGHWYEPDWSWISRTPSDATAFGGRFEAVTELARALIREFGVGAVMEAQLAGPAGDGAEFNASPRSERRVRFVTTRRNDGRYTIERVPSGTGVTEVAVERILAMRVVQAPGPDDDGADVREPRRPGPSSGSGAVAVAREQPARTQ